MDDERLGDLGPDHPSSSEPQESRGRPHEKALAARIGVAACDNALRLTEEARLLEENGHLARAFVSSVLAMEETGKAWAAFLVQEAGDDSETWDVFWGFMYDHKSNIHAALSLERLSSLVGIETPDELAQTLGAVLGEEVYGKKLRAMYVDHQGGEVVGPDTVAADEEALALAAKARKSVVIWAIILRSELEKALGVSSV